MRSVRYIARRVRAGAAAGIVAGVAVAAGVAGCNTGEHDRGSTNGPTATSSTADIDRADANGANFNQQEQAIRGAGRGGARGIPDEGTLARVPLGDWAGATPNTLASTVQNPYEGDRAAALEGGELYRKMNCADCHGYNLKGGMGPNLTDTYWRYGGSPAEIYKTLWEGRPQGMPAWGRALPPEQLWKLVTYIQSFGGTFSARLADRGKQGDLGDEDTSSTRTLRGVQSDW